MEKMRKLYICVYDKLKLSLYYLHLYCHYRHRLVIFFCVLSSRSPIISIFANYVLADEGYNSGGPTSANRNNNFLKDLLALNHG